MSRKYNFCAGPAALPEEVLSQAKDEMLDFRGQGLGVMEMSHRSPEIIDIAEQAEKDFRELMQVPENYKVLFLQGGATAQFAMVPLNLLNGKSSADYINTGQWSKKAIKEAGKFCSVNVVASSEDRRFSLVPDVSGWNLNKDAAYFHYTPNETIGGVEFPFVPEVSVPLVADMSSSILSRPVDVSRFAVIYAGAQKNIGPAGIAVVIVDEQFIGQAAGTTPSMFDYKIHADNDSMYNTPPTYSWYLAGLVFKWLKSKGGVPALEALNKTKAEKLYAYIDESEFYNNPVKRSDRSRMNVPFTLREDSLDKAFLEGAEKAGLLNLKGHRSVGGMRASLYNAVPLAAVDALLNYMADFAKSSN